MALQMANVAKDNEVADNVCSTPDQYQHEELDPRVKDELDKLNKATDEINKLETALEDANNSFRHDLSENSTRLQALGKKLGSAVEKARPYFEATQMARRLHLDCQRTAVQYHRANAVHQAARSTISLAEERFSNPHHQTHREFDPAWQEMLNHATKKVLEAEAGRTASEREHERRAAAFTAAQQRVVTLGRQFKSSIAKARPYFEQKELFDAQMEQMCQRVEQLQRAVGNAKLAYAHALRNLEQISEEIHEQRKFGSLQREPGVGAEEIVVSSENARVEDWGKIPSLNDDKVLKVSEEEKTHEVPLVNHGRCEEIKLNGNNYDAATFMQPSAGSDSGQESSKCEIDSETISSDSTATDSSSEPEYDISEALTNSKFNSKTVPKRTKVSENTEYVLQCNDVCEFEEVSDGSKNGLETELTNGETHNNDVEHIDSEGNEIVSVLEETLHISGNGNGLDVNDLKLSKDVLVNTFNGHLEEASVSNETKESNLCKIDISCDEGSDCVSKCAQDTTAAASLDSISSALIHTAEDIDAMRKRTKIVVAGELLNGHQADCLFTTNPEGAVHSASYINSNDSH